MRAVIVAALILAGACRDEAPRPPFPEVLRGHLDAAVEVARGLPPRAPENVMKHIYVGGGTDAAQGRLAHVLVGVLDTMAMQAGVLDRLRAGEPVAVGHLLARIAEDARVTVQDVDRAMRDPRFSEHVAHAVTLLGPDFAVLSDPRMRITNPIPEP